RMSVTRKRRRRVTAVSAPIQRTRRTLIHLATRARCRSAWNIVCEKSHPAAPLAGRDRLCRGADVRQLRHPASGDELAAAAARAIYAAARGDAGPGCVAARRAGASWHREFFGGDCRAVATGFGVP